MIERIIRLHCKSDNIFVERDIKLDGSLRFMETHLYANPHDNTPPKYYQRKSRNTFTYCTIYGRGSSLERIHVQKNKLFDLSYRICKDAIGFHFQPSRIFHGADYVECVETFFNVHTKLLSVDDITVIHTKVHLR